MNAGYIGVGATPAGPGGTASLVLNNSLVRGTTFELGALGLLSGDNGRIDVSGNVIIGGTDQPRQLAVPPHHRLQPDHAARQHADPRDPGNRRWLRRSIDCASGSTRLSTCTPCTIVFSFLGNTDPNSFVASGGFDLDNFIKSAVDPLNEASDLGLSTAFAAGQTWADVINPAEITVVSSVYDISNVQLRPDGTLNVVAVPVPEPSTWAMFAIGLMALSSMARRRAQARRR